MDSCWNTSCKTSHIQPQAQEGYYHWQVCEDTVVIAICGRFILYDKLGG